MAERYDVAIIGSGPGGYVAGIRAGQLGLKAVVIERESSLGGVCLNWGCIPTKALIKNAEMVNFLQRKAEEFGITAMNPGISWAKAVDRSGKVVSRMNRGVAGLLKKNSCAVIQGTARFTGPNSLAVTGPDGARCSPIPAVAPPERALKVTTCPSPRPVSTV
ncbi:MAG TPA: FAD-dependent oxidoreductase [Anaerolineae bacterium]|nr:FAD-dependent oxidoreductase [Anaerolineae bacterium]